MPDDFLIGVVGNCASGKTTLVRGLTLLGYRAVNIPQEHSVAPRLWRKLNVDFLVLLSCNLATARKRRKIAWGQERLDSQAAKLADARAHCQLHLTTDELTIEQVRQTVIDAVDRVRKEQSHAGHDNTCGNQTPSQG
jgi:hypothetical protein